MYNAAQLLTKIEALYDKVERAQSALTLARLNGEPDKEQKAVTKLEELNVDVRVCLTHIHDFLTNFNKL